MPLKLSNNAVGILASSLTESGTSVVLAPGQGAKFPALYGGDWFPITVVRSSEPTTFEIMHVTAREGDVLTAIRAQEGTTEVTFSVGDIVEHRLTSGALDRDFVRIASESIEGVRLGVNSGSEELKVTIHVDSKEEELVFRSDITHTNSDITPGRVIKTRDYGLGIPINPGKETDLNHIVIGGQYNVESPINGPDFGSSGAWIYLEVIGHSQSRDYVFQRAYPLDSDPNGYGSAIRIRRGGDWSPWRTEFNVSNFPPVGFVYVQYHPQERTPSSLFGGTWSLILNQAGLFFRTEGTGANPFDGTTQGDAIRNITGRIGPNRYQTMRGAMTGAFTQQGGGNDDFYTEIPNNNGQSGFVFDASRVVPTAPENRPRNNTFRIWRKDSH